MSRLVFLTTQGLFEGIVGELIEVAPITQRLRIRSQMQGPSPWRGKHPALKGLRPPEHHARQKYHPDQKDPLEASEKLLVGS